MKYTYEVSADKNYVTTSEEVDMGRYYMFTASDDNVGGGGSDVDISKENVELRDTCEFL